MPIFDQWIDRLARRVRWGEFLHRVANWLVVYLFAFGGMVLVGKLLVPRSSWPWPAWPGDAGRFECVMLLLVAGVVGGSLLAAIAWAGSRQSGYRRPELIAWLDRRLEAGGLLMTLSEHPDPAWSQRVPDIVARGNEALPRLRPVRFARHVALPLVFATIACTVPWRSISAQPLLQNTAGRQATGELVELLEQLQRQGVLDEGEEKLLGEQIAELAEDTRWMPLTHEKWETIDTLRQRMTLRLDSAAATIEKAREALDALAAEAADGDLDGPGPERLGQLRKDLEEALEQLARGKSSRDLPDSVKQQLQRLAKEGPSTARLPQDGAERQQLLDDLRDYLDREARQLEQLRQQAQQKPGGT